MARIVMIGGGIVGTCAALLLQRDGHDVTVLERDGPCPVAPGAAWNRWPRRSVGQFHQPHGFLARFTAVVRAELPDLAQAFLDAGALEWNSVDALPVAVTHGRQPGDERYTAITGRRPVIEAVAARLALAAGVDLRYGVGARGIVAEAQPNGVLDVQGVHTDDGLALWADVVIDAGGRRSAMPSWLQAAGATSVREEIDDCGFVYYGRNFRSSDGSLPPLLGPVVQPHGSISTGTLPADHGTWSVILFTSSRDAALRSLRDETRWSAVVRSCPLIEHWIDAEPTTEVEVMAKIEDRRRYYGPPGSPAVVGVLPLGDAWASTNPSLGRGISLGLLQAVGLRDVLREVGTSDPLALALAWQRVLEDRVEGYVADTLAFDRHRLAEMHAAAAGREYVTEDPGWNLGQALRRAASRHPDLLRAALDVTQVLARGRDVLARPGVVEQVLAHDPGVGPPGPDRDELLALVA